MSAIETSLSLKESGSLLDKAKSKLHDVVETVKQTGNDINDNVVKPLKEAYDNVKESVDILKEGADSLKDMATSLSKDHSLESIAEATKKFDGDWDKFATDFDKKYRSVVEAGNDNVLESMVRQTMGGKVFEAGSIIKNEAPQLFGGINDIKTSLNTITNGKGDIIERAKQIKDSTEKIIDAVKQVDVKQVVKGERTDGGNNGNNGNKKQAKQEEQQEKDEKDTTKASTDSYVCNGATMKCTFGTSPAMLSVYPDRRVFLTGQPMANISDHQSQYNIHSFGLCRTTSFPPTGSATAANYGTLTPMTCLPGTLTNWMNGKGDYIVKGYPALLKSSYCKCQWGGVITITNDGQTNTGGPDVNKESRDSEEEMKAKQAKQQNAANNASNVVKGDFGKAGAKSGSAGKSVSKNDNVAYIDRYERKQIKTANGKTETVVVKKTDTVTNSTRKVDPVRPVTRTGTSTSYGAGGNGSFTGNSGGSWKEKRIKVLQSKKASGTLTPEEKKELFYLNPSDGSIFD